MRALVIGLGSMGKRRIRLLHNIDNTIEIYGVDARDDRRVDAKNMCNSLGFAIQTFATIEEVKKIEKIDISLVCTSPASHGEIINECLQNNWNVFTEINLVGTKYSENIELAKDKGLILYLSSTPMFRREVKYITDRVASIDNSANSIYHVGQYLPDWHPWESYKDFFVGQKSTNGCREILAIELPWLSEAYGDITNIYSVTNKLTQLDIDFQDSYNILVEHAGGNKGMIVADVVCRPAVRYFETYGEAFYIRWDGTTDGLYEYSSGKPDKIDLYNEVRHQDGYNSMIIENEYEDELRDFLEVLNGEKNVRYSFEKDLKILNWIDEVEKC